MSKRKVLIVDDDADSARMLEVMLGAFGHEPRCARSGGDALKTAATFLPDGAVLDLSLPDLDGFELARALRAVPGLERTVLVAVTGWSDPDAIARARAEGFAGFLVKPVDVGQLVTLLGLSR